MREDRRAAVQRLEDLDLRRGVDDVILAADHMADAEVDVVHDAGERVEELSVGADQHRVRQGRGVDGDVAAHAVHPAHHAVIEPEAPVRPPSLGFQPRPVRRAQRQRGAVIDGRQAARPLTGAAALKLFWRLVGGVEAARLLQPFGRRRIEREAVRLPREEIVGEAEPCEIGLDPARELLGRALAVGVVQAQDEASAGLVREQPVEDRRPGVADMEPARRRRREADRDGHVASR